ncbi:hypothetical protein Ahy_B04g071811 isoform A [Arachis hypogaea]|uniref:Uncharacterized protein n=1 Tax=Arachis hypogaea TaxID=3818 RepID=A0A444ZLN1_ARAHY|nr:hypothetical protein Ahy_B04g071811 isoform A [Arachis hypogaea]
MKKQLLDCGAKSLCVGEGSAMAVAAMKHMGFSSVTGVHRHRFFSLKQKKIVICDTYTPAGEPISTNKRHNAAKIFSHPYVASKEPC